MRWRTTSYVLFVTLMPKNMKGQQHKQHLTRSTKSYTNCSAMLCELALSPERWCYFIPGISLRGLALGQ
jgi:hypothetical protein